MTSNPTSLALQCKQRTDVPITVKRRHPCPVCGMWTTAIYMHMIYSHNWTNEQVNDLKTSIREDKLVKRGPVIYGCYRCGMGYTSSSRLYVHMTKCGTEEEHTMTGLTSTKTEKDKNFMWYLTGSRPITSRILPSRPMMMPPLPEQLSESKRGSVICPVLHCTGRFTNHDSLSHHCLVEHAELGAAGTPQNFAIRQYRFDDKEAYKEWLFERCEETCTSFSTKTSLWSGYAMYRCNRAGTSKLCGRIRSGCISKKAQTHCSAFLRTSEYRDGSIDVTCCFGHIAHELDPRTLRLNERQCGVLQKLLEQNVCLSDIRAQMRSEYPPSNRLHYTTANDIRNLALRLGLPVRLKDRKALRRSANRKAEDCAKDIQAEQNNATVAAHSESCISSHSDSEDECKQENEDQKDEMSQDSQEINNQSNEQISNGEEGLSSSSSTSSARASIPPDGTRGRPLRIRRAPRRFEDN